MKQVYLGIDVGSVSTNLVVMDYENNSKIYESIYERTKGQPIQCVRKAILLLKEKGYKEENILGVGITGSGRTLMGELVGADIVKNEITAHAVAAIEHNPDVKTVLEIGGQDSKIIIIRNKVVVDFSMNTICAAGTGSFLDQQAFRLNIPIEEFGDYAVRAKSSVRIAGRCTVFAESDMIHKQQQGATKEEIISGLCEALVRNYLNNLAKGKKIEEPILFQGGVSFNKGIVAAFEKEFNAKIIIPERSGVMGAYGSAILAKEHITQSKSKTKFRGFDTEESDYQLRNIECKGCSNLCEISEIILGDKNVFLNGGRCGKWLS